jgi:hypothetical protein
MAYGGGLRFAQRFQLELEILREKLADEYVLVEDGRRRHAVAQGG